MSTPASRQPTADQLTRLHPLHSLSELRRRELAALCFLETVPAGQDPFRMRAADSHIAYLLEGELSVRYGAADVRQFHGKPEGLLYPLPTRPAVTSAQALSDATLLRIDRDLLDILLTWDQLTASLSHDVAVPAHSTTPVPNLRFKVLAELSATQLEELIEHLERVERPAGTVLIREGEPGDYYYLLESGAARVTRQVGGEDQVLATFGPGGAFGEEALVTDNPRNATVTLTRDSVLHRLAKRDFQKLLKAPLLHMLPPSEAAHRAAVGAVWVDVRYPSEYQYDRLPGAFNMPLNEIRNAVGVLSRDRDYLCYCESGRRAAAAAFLLSQHGYRAFALAGGLRQVADLGILTPQHETP